MDMNAIENIESRFKEVTGLTHLDLSIPHFTRGDNQQQKTTKKEFKDFGFVCTPLWLVDDMIEPNMGNLELTSKTCDACSGCGQFSIRLMRKIYTKFVNLGVSSSKMEKWVKLVWLPRLHYFTEFQFSNIAKLVYVFGPNINVYAGDTLNMKHSNEDERGILFFNEKEKRWYNVPGLDAILASNRDNLDNLLKVFAALEKRIMPQGGGSK